jgi:preprotein translocase subunit SecY
MKRRSAWRFLWTAKDIRRKILVTLGILVIYRLAAHVPVPGADRAAIEAVMSQGGAGASLIGFIDLISGGTVINFSVMAMGVYPYITAQIILQLLVPIIPQLQQKMEDDPREGRKWMERWTYILAIPMATLNAIGQIRIIENVGNVTVIPNFGFGAGDNILGTITILVTMTAGTMFAIWLGELISEYGIRNQGLSLIIFAGIISRIPSNFGQIIVNEQGRWILLSFVVLLTVLTIFAIVYVQQGRRNIPVIYPGRRVGRRQSMPVESVLPLMVNMAGMIPLIFGQALLQFPGIAASFFTGSQTEWVRNFALNVQTFIDPQRPWYWLFYFLFVVFFAFFYTDVLFQQQNYGENLKRVGARVKGVSPGGPTQRYLTRVLRRITFPGALFLGIVAVLPYLSQVIVQQLGIGGINSGALLVSSSGLLIVVGTVRDTFFNIDAELKLHGYDDSLLVR